MRRAATRRWTSRRTSPRSTVNGFSTASRASRKQLTHSTPRGGRTWAAPRTEIRIPSHPATASASPGTAPLQVRHRSLCRGAQRLREGGRLPFSLRTAQRGRGVARAELADGLPLITSTFEEAGLRYEIEQFAAPLLGPPAERRGDIAMVMLQKVTLRELQGKARSVSVEMQLQRERPGPVAFREEGGAFVLGDRATTWLAVQGAGMAVKADMQDKKTTATVTLDLPAAGRREFIVKLPSPVVPGADKATFLAIEYAASRAVTVKFWNDYLARARCSASPKMR